MQGTNRYFLQVRSSQMAIREAQPVLAFPDLRSDTANYLRFAESNHLATSNSSDDFFHNEEDLEIPWNEIVLEEEIGSGICRLH